MPEFECIDGPKLLAIFNQLTSDKTLVKVSPANTTFESLTVVMRTDKKGADAIFDIAPPKGLLGAIAESKAKSIHFEFTSNDRVTHLFDAEITNVSSKKITFLLPEFIQRHQQRDNFRVKVYNDSYAKLVVDDTEIQMAIDNISIGGVLCLCLNKHKSKFSEQQLLDNIELFITLDNECIVIPIQQIKVNRFERKQLPKHFGIAFEFIRIKSRAKKILVRQIYELQRHILQSRQK